VGLAAKIMYTSLVFNPSGEFGGMNDVHRKWAAQSDKTSWFLIILVLLISFLLLTNPYLSEYSTRFNFDLSETTGSVIAVAILFAAFLLDSSAEREEWRCSREALRRKGRDLVDRINVLAERTSDKG